MRRMWNNWNSQTFLMRIQNSAVTLETKFGISLIKVDVQLPFDPAIEPLGLCPGEMKTAFTEMYIIVNGKSVSLK